jgi:hypothetical protein
MTYTKIPVVLLFAIFSLVIFNSTGNAGDYSMQSNLDNMAELISIWSKQLSSGKMDAKAQEKLSELLSQTSQMLRDLSSKSGTDMHMQHHNNIKQMKKEWDPFDTTDRM